MKRMMSAHSAFLRLPFLRLVFFLFSFFSFKTAFSQGLLSIDAAHACLYEASAVPKTLTLTPADNSMEELMKTILEQTQTQSNFRLYAANVPSVAAVIVNGERYVLYNKTYFEQLPAVQKSLLLAHAIGHHAHKHGFKDGFAVEEEIEADEFAGFALYFMDFDMEAIEPVVNPIYRMGNDVKSRKDALSQGVERGALVLKVSPNMGYSQKEIDELLKNMPVFTLPPPPASAEIDLTPFMSACKKYEQANVIIQHALDETGYFAKKYYRTQGNGFAVVTKMEQFNKDGSSKQGTARWAMKPVRNETFSIKNYLESMFVPEPGYFRVIVFVIDDYYGGNVNPNAPLTRDTALAWLNQGYTSLPSIIGDKGFSKQTKVNALIYEFKVPESNKRFNFSKPSELDGRTHLKMAKILSNLRQ
jgi:hypothetical protein